MDREVEVKNQQVNGTKVPTGHRVLIDARYEVPYGMLALYLHSRLPYISNLSVVVLYRIFDTIKMEKLKIHILIYTVLFPFSPDCYLPHFLDILIKFCWLDRPQILLIYSTLLIMCLALEEYHNTHGCVLWYSTLLIMFLG